MEKLHVDILLKGEIQNIGFAFQTVREADKLQICGYIKYTGGNTAKIEAEGIKENLDEFVSWCKTGIPEAGKIDMQITTNIYMGFESFTISEIQILN